MVSLPLTVPMPAAPGVTGLSRRALYRAHAAGKIKLLKNGRSVLVDMESVRTYLAGLAEVATPQKCAA